MRTNKIVFRIACVALAALVSEALHAASVNSMGKSAKTDGDYMIIDLTPNAKGKFPVTFVDMSVAKANATFNTDEYKSGKIVLRKVAAGSSYYYRPHCTKPQSEKPLTETDKIPVTRDFWIGIFEVTEAQYARVFGRTCADITPISPVAGQEFSATGSFGTGMESCPCFMKHLCTNCVDVTGKPVGGFDLPTEAQWEIACRAGTATKFSCGDSLSADYAIYDKQYNGPQCVGMKRPNAWGIYDMHGNVDEWCRDRSCVLCNDSCRAKTAEDFCALREVGEDQIYRGGCWRSNAYGCASSTREAYNALASHIGFRLSRTAPALGKKASGKNKKAFGKK